MNADGTGAKRRRSSRLLSALLVATAGVLAFASWTSADEDTVVSGAGQSADAERCWANRFLDYSARDSGVPGSRHDTDDDAIAWLRQEASRDASVLARAPGGVDPGVDSDVARARVEAFSGLRRNREQSGPDRAVWTSRSGLHADVALVRTPDGWQFETVASELPFSVCERLLESRDEGREPRSSVPAE